MTKIHTAKNVKARIALSEHYANFMRVSTCQGHTGHLFYTRD